MKEVILDTQWKRVSNDILPGFQYRRSSLIRFVRYPLSVRFISSFQDLYIFFSLFSRCLGTSHIIHCFKLVREPILNTIALCVFHIQTRAVYITTPTVCVLPTSNIDRLGDTALQIAVQVGTHKRYEQVVRTILFYGQQGKSGSSTVDNSDATGRLLREASIIPRPKEDTKAKK
jgi:hypothetical protein